MHTIVMANLDRPFSPGVTACPSAQLHDRIHRKKELTGAPPTPLRRRFELR